MQNMKCKCCLLKVDTICLFLEILGKQWVLFDFLCLEQFVILAVLNEKEQLISFGELFIQVRNQK